MVSVASSSLGPQCILNDRDNGRPAFGRWLAIVGLKLSYSEHVQFACERLSRRSHAAPVGCGGLKIEIIGPPSRRYTRTTDGEDYAKAARGAAGRPTSYYLSFRRQLSFRQL